MLSTWRTICGITIAMAIAACLGRSVHAADAEVPDYQRDVAPIFTKYCAGCHNEEEPNGELNITSFSTLSKGSASGEVLVPGDADNSRLIRLIEKKDEPFMPPEGNESPTPEEIATLRRWIEAGAAGPKAGGSPMPEVPDTPKIAIAGQVRQPIQSVAFSPDGDSIAVARYESVEILTAGELNLLRTLVGHHGHVNDVRFSADGEQLIVAAGEPGLFGEATLWETSGWRTTRTFVGHTDSLYAAVLSPDGTLLATSSYDQKIKLWDVATGRELRQFDGHNGAVFDLAFHPQGKILASASDDKTVKLWNVESGERLDTFNEPTESQYTVDFSPDGRYVVAGGVDNRIRVWRMSTSGREGTNPMAYARFAHDAAILRLRFSADGRHMISSAEDHTVKIWETGSVTLEGTHAAQPDWVTALGVSPDNKSFLVGRLDGSLDRYALQSDSDSSEDRPRPLPGVTTPSPAAGADDAAESATVTETEPNNSAEQATPLTLPAVAEAVLNPQSESADVDLYRFEATAGGQWVIETRAQQDKSPVDTKIEVLHTDGSPVERLQLRAVRDSEITFRPIDSRQDQARLTNWEEMQLNQFLYMNGEVVKLFQAPRGPDSGFNFFTAGNGARRGYFGTSATVHPNHESVYIVEPYPSGAELVDNGLPTFPVNYVNDDDSQRKLGNDSYLMFTAPADGEYLVRVTDVRGFGGDDYKYKLIVRPPTPGFRVTVAGKNLKIGAGSGQRVPINLERIDGFSGEVSVDITGLPEGFYASSPVVVQRDHLKAQSVINVDPSVPPASKKPDDKSGETKDSPPPAHDWSKVKIIATAEIHGETITQDVEGFSEIEVTGKPKFLVTLRPDGDSQSTGSQGDIPELTIAPGTTITAMLSIERNGFEGELKFDAENMPHGVIIDNIGLSGVLIRKGENKRQIFITAADWVPETSRHVFAVSQGQGDETSWPVLLHVRKDTGEVAQVDKPAETTAP